MSGLLSLGLVLGLDNMRVAVGIAAVGVDRRTAIRLSLAFAVAETVMPFLGLLIGQAVSGYLGGVADLVGVACLAGCGLYVLFGSAGKDGDSALQHRPWALFGLPLVLGLDNLAAGVGLGLWDLPIVGSALVIGVMSTVMCLSGFVIGGVVQRSFPRHAHVIGGLGLVLVAALTALEG